MIRLKRVFLNLYCSRFYGCKYIVIGSKIPAFHRDFLDRLLSIKLTDCIKYAAKCLSLSSLEMYGCKCVPYTQNVLDSKKGRGSIVIRTRIPLVSKLLLQYVATQIGARMLAAESREVQ